MFKDKIRKKDLESIIKFSFAMPFACFLKRKKIWLFSERDNEARDNAYVLYKFIKENTDRENIYYVIDKNSSDAKKIEKLGNLINYNSFKHYIYYLASSWHISAHVDSDSPNSRVSNFLEIHKLLKNKKAFLQHGITKDKISFGYYSCCRADLFVCGAKKEFDFCKEEFGYPEGNVQLLGFPRFDNLWNFKIKRQILIMPTWRTWLANGTKVDFLESEYFKRYSDLLDNKRLNDILLKNNIQLLFLPHSDMQKYEKYFNYNNINICILNFSKVDIQKIIKESMMLITDYSSIAFDFAYMNKPLIYYHFDYDKYRKFQHPEGYFKYKRDGFGPVVDNVEDICQFINALNEHNFKIPEVYQDRINTFYSLRDMNNCKRVYNKLVEMEKLYE